MSNTVDLQILQNDSKTIPQSPLRGASSLCTREPLGILDCYAGALFAGESLWFGGKMKDFFYILLRKLSINAILISTKIV